MTTDLSTSSSENAYAMKHYDVAIIGGGINGLGIARDLALRGLSVYLAEKNDFGQGATGNSSGMIHGGIRYLLSDPEVTKQACVDSGWIQKIAQNMIFRVPFLLPIYDEKKWSHLYMLLSEVYFQTYDRFQPYKNGLPHTRLSQEEACILEPGLRRDHLIGALTTDEWGIDPFRLCMHNAQDAKNKGAVIENYCEVTQLESVSTGTVLTLKKRHTDNPFYIHARAVINCTGAWNLRHTHQLGIHAPTRPGKGVHVVYDRCISNYAIITEAIDGRQMFIAPHQNESWIGTTDDDYFSSPDELTAHPDEIEYLVSAVERVFPAIRHYRYCSTLVGLRPTIYEWGKTEDVLSREHMILEHSDEGYKGVFSMIGGKLASYRIMAQELSDQVCMYLNQTQTRCQTHQLPLPGHDKLVTVDALTQAYPDIDGVIAKRLIRRHGTHAYQILNTARSTPDGFDVVCACEPTLACEVRDVCRREWVHNVTDLIRRCRVATGPCLGRCCVDKVARIFAEETGQDQKTAAYQLYQEILNKTAALNVHARTFQSHLPSSLQFIKQHEHIQNLAAQMVSK